MSETEVTNGHDYGLYAVRTDDGREHDMVLCACCEPATADYYRMIGWKFWRVRAITLREYSEHVCLD